MAIKLNSFILQDSTIKKMQELLKETRDTGLEHGFTLCSRHTPKGEILIDKEHCVGTDCEIRLSSICENKDEILAGDYHTHPGETSRISEIDMQSACFTGVDCIGGTKDNEINCFIKNENINKDACKSDAKMSHNKNLSINVESDKIDQEKEILSSLINHHNMRASTSTTYSKEIDEESDRLSQLEDKLNTRIVRYNEETNNYWKFRNNITNKNFKKYRIV